MYNYGMGNDRRRFQRLSMNLCVVYRVVKPLELRLKFGDIEVEAQMIDISAGGMAIMTDKNIPASSMLQLRFSLFKLEKSSGSAVFYRPFEIKGQVRSNVRLEHGFRLGISFQRYNLDVSQEARAIARTVTVN
jgi:c-di-GMP-binding flagellar brake protein YcgR